MTKELLEKMIDGVMVIHDGCNTCIEYLVEHINNSLAEIDSPYHYLYTPSVCHEWPTPDEEGTLVVVEKGDSDGKK